MVRSLFIVVSDDQAVVQKAQQFGQLNGQTVQVWTPEQYDSMQSNRQSEVPSLVPGSNAVEGGKILPFPGTNHSHVQSSSSGDVRRSVATINQLESAAIENAIVAFKGNLTEAAKAFGIGRATLYRKVKQYNIDPSVARNKKKAA
jgi:transcriptional regulator of acetoin/glycerol metabolism